MNRWMKILACTFHFNKQPKSGFRNWCIIPRLTKLLTFLYRHSTNLLILRCERIATANRTALSSLPPCLISAPKMSFCMAIPIIFLKKSDICVIQYWCYVSYVLVRVCSVWKVIQHRLTFLGVKTWLLKILMGWFFAGNE